MTQPELAVRRSRVVTGLNTAMAAAVTVFTAWFGVRDALAGGVSWLAVATVVILIGLLVENLVFDTFERLTVKRWGMQR